LTGVLSLNAPEISFLQYKLEDLLVRLPENRFEAGKFHFQKITAENVSGTFNENLKGSAAFTLYGGKGNLTYSVKDAEEKFSAALDFNVKGLSISEFVRDLSDEVYISGILDLNGKAAFGKSGPEAEVSFRSKPARGVKQVMNFSAISVLASMGGGSPIKTFGSSDFGYNLIAGRLTVRNNYLTIEGLAGERGGQNLLIKGGTFGGINLSVDKYSNTISLEEIRRRAAAATQSMKR